MPALTQTYRHHIIAARQDDEGWWGSIRRSATASDVVHVESWGPFLSPYSALREARWHVDLCSADDRLSYAPGALATGSANVSTPR